MAQKGSGRARVGDKQSPIRRGGGVAHGPHPRDFSTDLPAKVYDQAWRIALSYRFKRGQLVVIDNRIATSDQSTPFLMQKILEQNGWSTKKGRSTFITVEKNIRMFDTIEKLRRYATIKHLDQNDVKGLLDVKNLLETERLIIEKAALDQIFKQHSRDLDNRPARAHYT